MSKQNTKTVFIRVFVKTMLIIILMFAVGFASYQGVFWYCKNNNGGKIKEKLEALHNKQEEGANILYTAVLFDDTRSSGAEGIMVKAFNSNTKNMDCIMIPTNTQLISSSAVYDQIKEEVDNLPETITIGDINTYIQDETKSYELTVQALEEILGIEDIPYYEAYNQKVLTSVVNLLDPQNMDVPIPISTKDTGGYELTLEAGEQELDGEKAAGLLEFKGYPNGDVDQAKVAAQYWSIYYQSVASLDETKKKDYYEQYYQLVTCNHSEEIMNQYGSKFLEIAPNQYCFHLLPGSEVDGQWSGNEEEIQSLFDSILAIEDPYETAQDMSQFDVSVVSSKDLDIEIYNSTTVEGLAGSWTNKLREEGYRVVHADTDRSGVKDHAIVYVKEAGRGLDLKSYFPKAEFITDEQLDGVDIRIVLGIAES